MTVKQWWKSGGGNYLGKDSDGVNKYSTENGEAVIFAVRIALATLIIVGAIVALIWRAVSL